MARVGARTPPAVRETVAVNVTTVCVFCGSSSGTRPTYAAAARELGAALAERGMTLVYGGGNVGLMGVLADAVLAAGWGRRLARSPKR